MNPNSFIRTSTFRLALLYVVLFSFSVLVLFGFIYWSTARYLATQTDVAIQNEIQLLSRDYRRFGLEGVQRAIVQRVRNQQPTGTAIYLLTDFRGQRIAGNISAWPKAEDKGGWINFQLKSTDKNEDQLHSARARPFRLPGGYQLLVGQDVFDLDRAQLRIVSALSWGLVITLVLGLLGGFFISRRMLSRIEVINETSREIIGGNLSRRIPSRGTGDEFDRLAESLNQMLDQIENLLDDIRRVSDNIAHDLKTPLARLRNRLELVRTNSVDVQGKVELDRALQEADQLLSTFNALLRIARIESGPHTTRMEPLELSKLAADVVELYDPVAEEKSLRLTHLKNDLVIVTGDRDMLFQVLSNLVDNACKYTPIGGILTVETGTRMGRGFVTVTDSGVGIPEAERERIFQRFYRLDQARSSPGNGLGLSLVQAVVRLHSADIHLEDNKPGLKITVTFPNMSD